MSLSSEVKSGGKPTPPPTLPKYTGISSSSYTSASYLESRRRHQESTLNSLQSKRELFFKNEPPTPANNLSTIDTANTNGSSTPPSAIKEALVKRQTERADSNESPEKFNKLDRDRSVPERKTKELDGYVGFANLPNQVYRKAVKKGFDFTLMVVGESGLGKSTLINSMFLADIYSSEYPGPSQRIKKTVQVETCRTLLKENGVNLTLTIVDTPGFGDAVDNSNCWQPIIEYIESRYEEYLNAESRVNRKTQSLDTRIHCCLYFIAPSGHGLKPLDVEFMQRLHDKVNIIPVIAKADTMTPEECSHFKKQILNEVAQHKIKIYEFPDSEEDDEGKSHGKKLKDRVPMAVVGSNTIVEIDGKKLRGRKYPWGVAEVENLEHSDFIALRNMLIRTHLQDLKDVTNNVHYENYRCRKLAGLGQDAGKTKSGNKNPLAQMEEEKQEHDLKMKKMETEMEQVFEMKVKEKKQKLKDSEADLQKCHEVMRKTLDNQIKELEEKKKALEAEKQAWEQANGVSLEELRRRSIERDSMDGKEKKNKKKGLF